MKGVPTAILLVLALGLAGCSTTTSPHARYGAGAPHASQDDPLQGYVPQPLPEIEHAEGLELVWDKVERGWMTGNSVVGGVEALSDSSFVVSGRHSGKLTLGHDDGNPTDLGEDDSRTRRNFLARYDASGALMWARNIGGSGLGPITPLADDSFIVSGPIDRPTMLGNGNDPSVSTRFGAGTPRETRVAGCEPVVEEHQRLLPDEKYMPQGYTHRRDHSYAPGCRISFVARYDSDGNLQWIRTIHTQFESHRVHSVLPDGSVVVAAQVKGVALLDAGTSEQQRIRVPFPPKRHVLGTTPFTEFHSTPFLIRYAPDGSVSWVRQLGEAFELMRVEGVVALSDGTLAIAALKGTYWGEGQVSPGPRYDEHEFAPRIFVGRLDGGGRWLWHKDALVIDTPSTKGGVSADLTQLPGDDLLVTYRVHSVEAPIVVRSDESRVVHQAHFDDEDARWDGGTFATRFDAVGRARWHRQLARRGRTIDTTVLSDGSWLVGANVCGQPIVFGPGHARQSERESAKGCQLHIARFGPDGELDAVFDPRKTSENIAGFRFGTLPDGSLLSAGTKPMPNTLAQRFVMSRFRLSFDSPPTHQGSDAPTAGVSRGCSKGNARDRNATPCSTSP
jgi:hypothetical protein